MASQGNAAFAFIFATVALDMLALGVIVPVLPKLIVEFDTETLLRRPLKMGCFSSYSRQCSSHSLR